MRRGREAPMGEASKGACGGAAGKGTHMDETGKDARMGIARKGARMGITRKGACMGDARKEAWMGKAGKGRTGGRWMARAAVACAVALAGGMLALAGCAAPQQGGSADEELTPVTVVLDYTPNTNHTGLYVAMDQGFYADRGLAVTVVQPPEDGADAMVASGQAQFGVSYQDWMANYLGSDDPLPVTAVAALVQHNTSGIISRAGDGITHPAGLQGKRYGTLDVATEKAIVRALVEGDGGSWDAVELVPANSTDEVTGLATDQFDAVWCFEGWAGQNAAVQGFDADYFSIAEIDPVFDYYTPVLIVNDAFAAAEPDVVRAFLAATAEGYAFAAESPDEAAAMLMEAAPEVDPDLALASQRFLADQYVADAAQWGVFDAARWNAFYAWMNEQGLTERPIPLDAGFTNEYLQEG